MVPFLARFRMLYEQTTIPLGGICVRFGLSPDMLTITSLVIGGAAAFVIARGNFYGGIALILLMGLFDVLDGATARAGGTASTYGTVFDHVIDRYAEFLILLGIMLNGAAEPGWTLFALFGMVMASYVRARAESTGQLASCNVGFAGRQEKLGLLIIGLALQPLLPELRPLHWLIILVGVLSHITAVQRLLYAKKMLGSRTHE
ncbi:MAG: CDP-alcohol phosphatidyltransferase family protein [Roseiflexaceae bacterium]|nr:CDP-alcohol phosphatidyltransferase family protein [Roseiflexaceae bacterium]